MQIIEKGKIDTSNTHTCTSVCLTEKQQIPIS